MDPRGNTRSAEPPQNDSLTPEQEYEKSAQEIMTLGQQASHLLGNPVYNTLYNLKLQRLFGQWLNTIPKEERLRESLYHEARALVEMTSDLGSLVADAEQLLAEEAERNSPEGRQRRYQEQQGFGTAQ